MLTYLVDIGHCTGLFAALAEGPATSAELAACRILQERYVREWLAAMATGGIVDYEFGRGASGLGRAPGPPDRPGLGQPGPAQPPSTPTWPARRRRRPGVPGGRRRALRRVPARVHRRDGRPRARRRRRAAGRRLPAAGPGGWPELEAGARVADTGAGGTGHAMVLLAGAFPRPRRSSATTWRRMRSPGPGPRRSGWPTSASRPRTWPGSRPSDPSTWCSSSTPSTTRWTRRLRCSIHAALVPGGTLVMVEPRASSNLEDNLGDPLVAFLYGISTLHRMTVSLAGGGAGLRTVWGEQAAWPCWPRPASASPCTKCRATLHQRCVRHGPAAPASTWTPIWRLSRPRMAEMPRRRRGEITRSRPRAVEAVGHLQDLGGGGAVEALGQDAGEPA